MSDSKDTKHMNSADSGALATPDGSLQPGQVLQSRYRVLGIIGIGGMGAVYQARDLNFANVTRLCAVKEMINLTKDPKLREQTIRNFEREAEILATLSHPAIPQIYDFFSFGDRAYLVMEFIQGRDLEALINGTDKFLQTDQVVEWGIQICDVLGYLHNREPEPVVFRDMKPANVMIDHHKNIRLIDFGIAKTFQMGQPGTMIGTEGYSPPEQYKGISSPAGDIYALGATLHHLLTRRDPRLEPPFSFDQRAIQDYNPNIPENLIGVVNRALNYDPKQRYASSSAMKQSLEAIRAQNDPSVAAMVSTPPASPQPVGATPQPQSAPGGIAPVAIRPSNENVSPIWAFKAEDAIRSTPVVQKNMLYVGSYDNNLWAIDIETGEYQWRLATDGGIGSSPVYSSGAIFVGSSDTFFYSINVRNGKRNWRFKTDDRIFSTPRVALGSIFFGSGDGKLYAIKAGPSSAKEVWNFNAMISINSSPAIDDEKVYFGCDGGEFLCLDVSGGLKWRFQARRRILSSPTVAEGIVYFGSDDWQVYALKSDQGYPVWKFRTKGAVVSSPTFHEGKVYFGSADGFLYALDALSGKVEWKYEVGRPVMTTPTIYREAIYFGSSDKSVYSVHLETGELLWRFESEGPILSSPHIVDDIVYIGSDDHHVYALQA